jgi:ELWxxDGT repeat protein
MKKIIFALTSIITFNIYPQSIDVTEIEFNTIGDSNPHNLTKGISKIYFLADNGIEGKQLWVNNTSTNKTYMVKVINGIDNSIFLTIGDILYFTINIGTELWRSDGTELGTYLVKHINSNSWSNNTITKLFNYNNKVIFGADDDLNGKELWISDGTTNGTTLLKDINAGSNSSNPSNFFTFNGSLYFTANDGINGYEIWKSDGTTSGTSLFKNIDSSSSNSIIDGEFIILNNAFYFYANNNINGFELWKSDGTPTGTQLFKDINVGNGSSNYTLIGANTNSYFIFEVNSSTIGTELWKSDGTVAGTILLKDINIGSNNSVNNDTQFAVLNDKIYFNATTSINGNELWGTDGTTSGTQLVKDIYIGTTNSEIVSLTAVSNYLIFSAHDNTHTYNSVWISNGTNTGTFELKNINLTQYLNINLSFVEFNNKVFFSAGYNSSKGVELWTTDGTTVNTIQFYEISHRLAGITDFFDSAEIGGKLIFTGNNGNGNEPFITDGTINGSQMIKDIIPGSGGPFYSSDGFRPASYTKAGNYVYFRASSAGFGFEIWKTNGTEESTSIVKDINVGSSSSISEFPFFLEFNNIFYFKANDGIHGEELWRSDGSSAGTYMVKDINIGSASSLNGLSNVYYNNPNILNQKCYAILNGFLYFTANDGIDNSIWRTDGTQSGTTKVIIIPTSGVYDNNTIIINATNNKFFFKTNTNNSSYGNNTLWSSDGTQLGTVQLFSTNISGTTQFKKNIVHNNNLYYTIFGTNGNTLMKSDGTAIGTIVVKENFTTQETFNALTSCGNEVYFAVGVQGIVGSKELWRTNGTNVGTIKLGDLTSSNESFIYCNTCYQNNLLFKKDFLDDNKIYFVNTASTNTDNFLTTNIVNSENFGEYGYYSYADFYNLNNKLLFTAAKKYSGYELYSSEFNITLDISDFDKNINDIITMYPNPAKDFISFKTNENEMVLKVDIFNLLGENIYSSNIVNNKLLINIENGMYLVNIITNKSQYSAKLIIQK